MGHLFKALSGLADGDLEGALAVAGVPAAVVGARPEVPLHSAVPDHPIYAQLLSC